MGKYIKNIEKYINTKYNSLTIIGPAKSRLNEQGRNIDCFLCKCDCGNEVIKDAGKVIKGKYKGCGMKGCKFSYNITHGLSKTRLYAEYMRMRSRCYNKNDPEYHNYGEKGIKISLIWNNEERITDGNSIDIEGLKSFIEWAYSHGYYDQPKNTPKRELLSIERINVYKDYSPENCTWIPLGDQGNNKRTTSYIWDGEEWLSYGQFYKKYNLYEPWINTRLKAGWSFSAIVYAAKNQDLGIRMDKHTVQPKLTTYVTKDGFNVLIPILHPPKDDYHKQVNKMKYAGVVIKQTPEQVKKYRKNRKEKLLKEGNIKEALKVNLTYPSNGTGTWTWGNK